MAVLLAFLAALAYGLSDFVAGVASRRVNHWAVAFTTLASAAALVLVLGLLVDGDPTGPDLAWGAVAGLGNGVGTVFLYRGLAAGRMGVVAPLSGVGAALIPLVVGLGAGERPGLLAWLGIGAALPAIWLVAREPLPDLTAGSAGTATGVVDGILAGAGFGVLFAALGQVPEEAGVLPLSVNQAVGMAVILGAAVAARQPWVPREPAAYLGVVCGVLGASATALFLAATQTGLLTVAAVITSLYPAFTVVLAATALREPVHRAQAVGLVLCGVAVGLIAAG